MASDRDSCITHMPDGRRFELCSEEGANAFIRYGTAGSFNWFTMNIPTCKMIRGSNRRLSAGDKERLLMIGFTADSFSGYCDQSVFAECVSDDEIVFWLDYVMDELKEAGSAMVLLKGTMLLLSIHVSLCLVMKPPRDWHWRGKASYDR